MPRSARSASHITWRTTVAHHPTEHMREAVGSDTNVCTGSRRASGAQPGLRACGAPRRSLRPGLDNGGDRHRQRPRMPDRSATGLRVKAAMRRFAIEQARVLTRSPVTWFGAGYRERGQCVRRVRNQSAPHVTATRNRSRCADGIPLHLSESDVPGRPWISPVRPHNPLVAGSSPARPTTRLYHLG